MTLEQWVSLGTMIYMLASGAILVGLWRGRQEAADKASEQAIKNTETLFGERLKTLEQQVSLQAEKMELRIRIVDSDINGLKGSIAEVKQRMTESEAERREEFQRLHKIGNDTHALIVQHLTKLQDHYVPRPEFESRSEDVLRRLGRLEGIK